MHPQHQSQVENVQPQGDRPAYAPQPTPSAPRRPRWRIPVVVAAILVPVLLAAAGVITYLAGGFNDDGRFRAEPPACATLTPSLDLLGTAYTTEQDESNNCDLLLPLDHPDYIPFPKISVSYGVATSRREDAPDVASEMLGLLETEADVRRLPGVGDEAILRDRDVFLRVSNLVVAIVVFPQQVSTEDQVLAFATDLANRLQGS